jgi:hypothetical protein
MAGIVEAAGTVCACSRDVWFGASETFVDNSLDDDDATSWPRQHRLTTLDGNF